MLINSLKLLKTAKKEGYCVPAFNVYNLETIRAAFTAAEKTGTVVITAFGESYLKYVSFEVIANIVGTMSKERGIDTVLHLDHCKDPDNIKRAIEAGFTSVMYDGSHYDLETNIKNTRLLAELAHSKDVTIEGELGYLNPEDGSASIEPGKEAYTNPEQAGEYVESTGVDSLAVVVGNAHGLYKGTPHLEFDIIENINKLVDIPLVLHGASGIPEEQIKRAVATGVAKINVNTEIALLGSSAAKAYLDSNDKVRFEILMEQSEKAMTRVMADYINMVGGSR